MKVNVNKEQLIKHHFWILSACYLLVVLIPLFLLWTGVSGAILKEKEDLEKTKKNVSGYKDPKNQKWVDAYTKQDGYVERKKNDVWKQAWELQKDMMTWPPDLQETFSRRYPYMGDPISDTDAIDYGRQYSKQFPELYELVDPVRSRDTGAVQFKTGNSLEGMVALLDLKHDFNLPTKDDIWLAQEDLWVKRELLRIVRNANDSVAFFKEVKPGADAGKSKPAGDAAAKDKKEAQPAAAAKDNKEAKEASAAAPPPSDPNHKIFRNAYWQLELTLSRTNNDKNPYQLSGKITNITDHKLGCGNVYRVFVDEDNSVGLPIDREPLAAGESYEFPKADIPQTVQVRGLYGVEQIFTWRTAPVKRIDDLRINYNSSRTASIYRLDLWERPRWSPAETKPEGEGGDPNAGAAGETMGKKMMGMGMMGMAGGTAASGDVTKHQLQLRRYTDTNEQVRHMPVALVVVMDEANIPDFLAAVDNSKLRIQLLQFHWHHLRGERLQPPAEESPEEPSRAVASTPGVPRPGIGVPGMPPGGGGWREQMQQQSGMMNRKMGAMLQASGGSGVPPGFPRRMTGFGGAGAMGGPLQRIPGGPGFTGTPGTEEEEEAEMNLVEVAVYGLASLYEKYPPKPAAAAPSGEQK
jgi:hypothetical protein